MKYNGIQLSIKHAYTLLLKEKGDCTFEQFRTYGYLVKLGFRVFRHDAELKKTSSYNSENLTKKPEIPTRKKRYNANDNDEFYNYKDRITFPELESTGWVVLSKPPLCFTPYNIQPDYDVYTFNITVSSNTVKITEVISFYDSLDFKKTPFYPGKQIVYDALPTGMYPKYERNIKNVFKNVEQIMYEPQIKRLKLTKTEEAVLSIPSNTKTSTDETNVCKIVDGTDKTINDLKYEENMDTDEDCLPIITNVITSTLNIKSNLCSSNNNVNLDNKILKDSNEKNYTLSDQSVTSSTSSINFNTTKIIKSNCNPHKSEQLSNTDAENEAFNTQLPSNIINILNNKLYLSHSLIFFYMFKIKILYLLYMSMSLF